MLGPRLQRPLDDDVQTFGGVVRYAHATGVFEAGEVVEGTEHSELTDGARGWLWRVSMVFPPYPADATKSESETGYFLVKLEDDFTFDSLVSVDFGAATTLAGGGHATTLVGFAPGTWLALEDNEIRFSFRVARGERPFARFELRWRSPSNALRDASDRVRALRQSIHAQEMQMLTTLREHGWRRPLLSPAQRREVADKARDAASYGRRPIAAAYGAIRLAIRPRDATDREIMDEMVDLDV